MIVILTAMAFVAIMVFTSIGVAIVFWEPLVNWLWRKTMKDQGYIDIDVYIKKK